MSDEQPTPAKSDHRTTIIAGLRAIADFLETRPEIPEPDRVDVQYSVIDRYDPQNYRIIETTDDEKIAEVRRIAGLLGVEAEFSQDGGGVATRYKVADQSIYTVHAKLTPAGGDQS
jgi:hypothetical protein